MRLTRRLAQQCTKAAILRSQIEDMYLRRYAQRFESLGGSVEAIRRGAEECCHMLRTKGLQR